LVASGSFKGDPRARLVSAIEGLHATTALRERVELSRVGLHPEEIDEDISVAGLLAGRGDMTRQPTEAV
jgi:hypothetical protein